MLQIGYSTKRGSQKGRPVGRHNFDDFIRWYNSVPMCNLLHVCMQLFTKWLFVDCEMFYWGKIGIIRNLAAEVSYIGYMVMYMNTHPSVK